MLELLVTIVLAHRLHFGMALGNFINWSKIVTGPRFDVSVSLR